jgi:hypothetical protein
MEKYPDRLETDKPYNSKEYNACARKRINISH